MSLFANESAFISNAAEPGTVPDATYKCFLFDIKKGATAKGDKDGVTFIYRIGDGNYEGEDVREWLEIPRVAADAKPTPDQEKKFGRIKARLVSLGVPAERVGTVDAEDLIGTKVYVTTKTNNGYVNVNKVTLDTEGDTSSADSPFGI
jgi:hypothetical protein